jgi:hypothetical protein
MLMDADYIRCRSLSHSETVDEEIISRVVHRCLAPLREVIHLPRRQRPSFLYAALPVEECEKEFDIKSGIMSTLLCYLQLRAPELVRVLPENVIQAKVFFLRTHPSVLMQRHSILSLVSETLGTVCVVIGFFFFIVCVF